MRPKERPLFIQHHGEGHGLRAELHRRRAERVGGPQRMPPLHAAVTVPAVADRDAKLVHDGTLDGEVVLVLRDDPGKTPCLCVSVARDQREERASAVLTRS